MFPQVLSKQIITSLSSPLTHILNLSLSSGVVSAELKIARVVPLFKTCNELLFSNFGPIFVLPSFS